MNLHWADWAILSAFVLSVIAVALYTKRFLTGVTSFLVADRCAGRYLLGISQATAGYGAIGMIATFQAYYDAGFGAIWWAYLMWPMGLLVTLSGYLIYRYRETRVMTMSQLFETRYSRKFRIFCGILIWSTGIINMGIVPAVFAKFFIYYCGLASYYTIFGFTVSTFVVVMIMQLTLAIVMVLFGGMIVVLVTDFFQGMFCNCVFLVIAVFLFQHFSWSQISSALLSVPENASKVNPFKMLNNEGFNVWFFIMQSFMSMYAMMAWQGTQGFAGAAKNAHELKMSSILGTWRDLLRTIVIMLLPICAFTLMTHAEFTGSAAAVNAKITSIDNSAIQGQVLTPVALSQVFPMGLLGMFACVMLASAVAADGSYLHSWGSIFIQDVVLPLTQKDLTPGQHVRLLRYSIAFVAVFIFFFSLFFKQTDYIIMYQQSSAAMYLAGAGSVIIGGLYWKYGSTLGAWSAMIVGGIVALGGLTLQQLWPSLQPDLLAWFSNWQWIKNNPSKFPLNGMHIAVISALCAIAAYVTASLLSHWVFMSPAFEIDKMLRRGKYAIEGEHLGGVTKPVTGLRALLPTEEFSFYDKFLYFASIVWTLVWVACFILVTIYHFVFGTTDRWWCGYWHFYIGLILIIGIGATCWFVVGGARDLLILFRTLRKQKTDLHEDGSVQHELIKSKS